MLSESSIRNVIC